MEQIKKLLEEISIINKKNAEILDATGGRFNMFRVCGVNHYENTHSAILAEFLNPNGSHGLKSKLLECFIENLEKKLTVTDFDCTNAHISREYATDQGRMDIVIADNKNHAIIIENKIYAGDQWEQLQRYNTFAKKQYGKNEYQILYLTLSGNEASEQSSGGVEYTTISYKTDIISWLEKCMPIAEHYPMVRETIRQYINHLKQLTHQDMDSKNKEKIISMILRDKQLIESAHYVVTIWQECHSKIHVDVKDNINRVAQELKLEYVADFDGRIETGAAFSLFKKEWKNSNYCVFLWFEQKPEAFELCVGVHKIYHEDIPWKDGVKEKLTTYLSDFNIKNYTHSFDNDYWAWVIKWENLNLFDFPEKLSYNAILEVVEPIVKKLDGFKE